MGGLDNMNRRDFIRVSAAGVVSVGFGGLVMLHAGEVRRGAKAKSVIQLWMGGGPSHLDTFDPKPRAGVDYCGPYRKPIKTNVSGVRICQKLPMLAKHADKYSIIRGMTHGHQGHEKATYIVQTGMEPGGGLVYPSLGAVVGLKKGDGGKLPSYITIPKGLGRFSEAGFLGARYKPFETGGDPNAKNFAVQGIAPPKGMSQSRLERRRGLLDSLEKFGVADTSGKLGEMERLQERAYEMILSDAKRAFDLGQESEKVRARYGRNKFGQSCLLARRLVERGVGFVTVNFGGWDTHKQNFEKLDKQLPVLDKGFSALLEDLSQRGLLDSTIVTWGGEFGRKPEIDNGPPWNGGRGHHGNAFCCVVAGGGFKGGAVVGETDFRGERVRKRPVYPWDLTASIYELLGIDPKGKLPHPHGCVAYVTALGSGGVQSGGSLKEIM